MILPPFRDPLTPRTRVIVRRLRLSRARTWVWLGGGLVVLGAATRAEAFVAYGILVEIAVGVVVAWHTMIRRDWE